MTQNILDTSDNWVFSVVGFNPAWNETFHFDVYVPELALVSFIVEDYDSMSDNEFVAQYTLPFNSLQMGEFTNAFHTAPSSHCKPLIGLCCLTCLCSLMNRGRSLPLWLNIENPFHMLHKELFIFSSFCLLLWPLITDCHPFVLPRRIQTCASAQ